MTHLATTMQNLCSFAVVTISLAALGLVQPAANAAVINVAMGGRGIFSMADVESTNYAQSTIEGTAAPLPYTGTTWNQINGGTGLLDSDGAATPVGFSISGYKDENIGDHGGAGILNLLGGCVHSDGNACVGGYSPDPGTLPMLVITGLDPTKTYDLVIVSSENSGHQNDFNVGGAVDTNSPNSPTYPGIVGGTTLHCCSTPRDMWVEGSNYVMFSALMPAGDGTITVLDRATGGRFVMNAFQLQEHFADPTAVPFVDITNDNFSVGVDQTVIGGTNAGVMGFMTLESMTGATVNYTASIPATSPWTVLVSNLVAGTTNIVRMTVTNGIDQSASDSVRVYRRPGVCVDITNITDSLITVPDTTDTLDIAGTNTATVVGDMTWSNSRGGSGTLDPAPRTWIFTATLALGNNVITVRGTNDEGDVASDSVTIVRGTAPPIINVAMGGRSTYSMAGVYSSDCSQSTNPGTAAPLDYSGNTWNQMNGGNNLLDSDGTITPVGFSISGYKDTGIGDNGGPGILNLLGGCVHADGPACSGGWNPDPGTIPTLVLTGLDTTVSYDLVIVSAENGNNENDFNVGGTVDFTDPAYPVFVGGTTLHCASNPRKTDEWVEGTNYVRFAGLAPDADGMITVYDRATMSRFGMNGFQLQRNVPEPAAVLLCVCALVRALRLPRVGLCVSRKRALTRSMVNG